MIELERTFLAKKLPDGLNACKFKEILDIYIPKSSAHPILRIRKNGEKYEITKKQPVIDGDASEQEENTIPLSKQEFEELSELEGKRVRKLRYYYNHNSMQAEIDVFQDELKGLVLVDFEFENSADKDSFEMPRFCLAEVTQELFTAGGMLCGKKYSDIKEDLEKYGYEGIFF